MSQVCGRDMDLDWPAEATTSTESLWSSLLISDHVSFHVHVPFGLTSAEKAVHCLPFALLADGGAVHPDLNPFFYFLAIVFKYRILPVPWPVRLLALWDQLSKWEQWVSIKCHNSECFQRILKVSTYICVACHLDLQLMRIDVFACASSVFHWIWRAYGPCCPSFLELGFPWSITQRSNR